MLALLDASVIVYVYLNCSHFNIFIVGNCTCSWHSLQQLLNEKVSQMEELERSWSDYDAAYVNLLSQINECQKELDLLQNDNKPSVNKPENLSRVKVCMDIALLIFSVVETSSEC
jgi:hypothetical protein